jgi:hypothetical protein
LVRDSFQPRASAGRSTTTADTDDAATAARAKEMRMITRRRRRVGLLMCEGIAVQNRTKPFPRRELA